MKRGTSSSGGSPCWRRLTCTLGNLAAYGQTNMKRLLAYSTIAHAGYLMMGVAAAVALAGRDDEATRSAVAAVCFYLGTYVFMNLAAFAIVALLRNSLRSEEIASYAGLIRSNPGIVVATGVVLVSLIGLPPLAGFVSKFLVFSSVMEAVMLGAERPLMLVLIVVGGANTVISLFYYLRVLKVMTFDPPPADRTADAFPLVSIPGALVTAARRSGRVARRLLVWAVRLCPSRRGFCLLTLIPPRQPP